MSSADSGALHAMLGFLAAHRPWAYPVLFLGAYFETVLPFSLFVPGEAFLLGGALLAGAGALDLGAVAAALCAGGLLGDHSSYWLGRRCGAGLLARPSSGVVQRIRTRGCDFFRRRGASAVFWARLAGPLSWVTPTLAGAFELDYRTFLTFNTPGVLLGIGEFLLIGYCFGAHLGALCATLQASVPAVAAVTAAFLGLLVLARCRRQRLSQTDDAARWSVRDPVQSR
ncbi:MAG: DedA family protein [Steroidobacteraceae bacterium]